MAWRDQSWFGGEAKVLALGWASAIKIKLLKQTANYSKRHARKKLDRPSPPMERTEARDLLAKLIARAFDEARKAPRWHGIVRLARQPRPPAAPSPGALGRQRGLVRRHRGLPGVSAIVKATRAAVRRQGGALSRQLHAA